MQITRSKVAWRGAIITRSSPLSPQNWLAVVRPGLIIPYAPNQTSRMKVPVDPLLPRPCFQLSLQRRDESQLIIALITSACIPFIGIGDACLEILDPQPRAFRIDTALRARVITVRSTGSACNSRPSFPAFLLVALAKFGRQETRAEDVHAWNSFLIGGKRRVKALLSFPIDRYTIEFEHANRTGCKRHFRTLTNRMIRAPRVVQ